MRYTDQEVPKPDRYEGTGELKDGLLTGQDNRLGYDPGTGDIKSVEQLKEMRNNRDV